MTGVARAVALTLVPVAAVVGVARAEHLPTLAHLGIVVVVAWLFYLVAQLHGDAGRLGGAGEVGAAALLLHWLPPTLPWTPPTWAVPALAVASAAAWVLYAWRPVTSPTTPA